MDEGGYLLDRQIGSGTYGQVYKVFSPSGSPFVLKKISLNGLTPDEQEEAIREARLMVSLGDHPALVRHHESFILSTSNQPQSGSCLSQDTNDIDIQVSPHSQNPHSHENKMPISPHSEQKSLHIVMEYCEGGDLGKLIQETKLSGQEFSEEYIWGVFVQLCRGLGFLHENRVLHRDLKPENVFLDRDRTKVKIGDLGLSKLLSSQSRNAKSTVGTPLYFSPELCREESYDERSDVWALGCLIYHMAALRPPFQGKNALSLAQKIVHGQLKPLPHRFSSDLRFIVHRMLEKNPRDRPNVTQLLNYGPTKLHVMAEQTRERETQMALEYERREARLLSRTQALEKKLAACELEIKQMRLTHEAILQAAQLAEHEAREELNLFREKCRQQEKMLFKLRYEKPSIPSASATANAIESKAPMVSRKTRAIPPLTTPKTPRKKTGELPKMQQSLTPGVLDKRKKVTSVSTNRHPQHPSSIKTKPKDEKEKRMGTSKASKSRREKEIGTATRSFSDEPFHGDETEEAEKENCPINKQQQRLSKLGAGTPPPQLKLAKNLYPSTGPSPLKLGGPARRVPFEFVFPNSLEDDGT